MFCKIFICFSNFLSVFTYLTIYKKEEPTRPAWAGFKTAEEGRTKIMLIYT